MLLVEDEPLISLALQDALEKAGYEVVSAGDGHAASEALDHRLHEVSGLITDIRLGVGPDGWSIACRARQQRPDLPVLYVTGDSGPDWGKKGVLGSALLQKPFASERMLAELDKLLSARP